ncbi:MAG: response regulator transcription factor [Steroidobacteraceae bacterium]
MNEGKRTPADAPWLRLILIEDDARTRDALLRQFACSEQLQCVGAADSVAAAAPLLAAEFDVALVDLRLPDGDGTDLIRRIAAADAGRALVLTAFGDEASVIPALEAGAQGYILKDADDVVEAILAVHRGEAPLNATIARHLLDRIRAPARTTGRPDYRLTKRELEILDCLARGLSYREVADEISISRHTVSDHLKAIYRKLAVKSRSAAVFRALRSGLLDVRD